MSSRVCLQIHLWLNKLSLIDDSEARGRGMHVLLGVPKFGLAFSYGSIAFCPNP